MLLNQKNIPDTPGLVSKIDLTTASSPDTSECLINANNDLEATLHWLALYSAKKTTFKSYHREALRFLLWCTYENGKAFKDLKIDDLQSYFKFLQNPPSSWLASQISAAEHVRLACIKGISAKSAKYAITVINSLLNYLVEANYLKNNPLRLAKKSMSFEVKEKNRKYEVWSKILDADEWAAILKTINALPSETERELDIKMRTRFLFALLYFLGLRINEVATHTWGDFRIKEDLWWIIVQGKGDKVGHVPVNNELLSYIYEYRAYLELDPWPDEDETESLIISKYSRKPYKVRSLYNLVKTIGNAAADCFPNEPFKQRKLRNFSPHSLRHLSASHQASSGVSLNMIRENLRHASINTTQIYVHTDDVLRHNAIQQLAMSALDESRPVKKTTRLIHISVERSDSLNIVNACSVFLKTVEEVIFKNINFIYPIDMADLSEEIELFKKMGRQIDFFYETDSELTEQQVSHIQNSIIREAKVRLLTTIVKVTIR